MWELTLKTEKENSYVTETLHFEFENYGGLVWFLGEAMTHSKGNTKAIIEYKKKEEVEENESEENEAV